MEVRRIMNLAQAQHGVVARVQLLAAGISRHAIDRQLAAGWLAVVHRGIYLVGPSVETPLRAEMAAVLAGGRNALLSHCSAAALHGIAPVGPRAEITVVASDCRLRNVTVHRTGCLDRCDRWTRDGIPVTAPARTLIDLATVLDARELRRAYDQATVHCRLRPAHLAGALARRPNHRDVRRVRALLESKTEPQLTRSEAEKRLLDLIHEAGLPAPRTNVLLHGLEVDAHWPEQRLVVEVDGYAFHGHRAAFERDARRSTILQLAGERVLRVTWSELVDHQLRLAGELGLAIGAVR